MPQAHKHSFLITLGLIFLLPIFFIPGGALSLLSAKSALLTLGVIVALLTFIYEVWQSKTLRLPKHHFLVVVMLLPVLYALSAVLSTPSSLSLFGYSFEVGTFGSMLLGALLLILISTIFSDTSRILTALSAVFVSFSIIALFAGIKVVFGPSTLLGVNNMGNPLGNWTDLSMACGLLALFSALTLGMIPLKLSARILLYVVFALSTILLAVVHFGTALIFTLIASILLALYFAKVEKQFLNIGHIGPMKPIVLPIILAVVCLIFLVNPVVTKGGTKLGDIVADTFNITNTDVRPSFSATLGISKAVLSQAGLFGSGPNTFGHDWLIYKPATVNGTPFWGVAFPFGAGFVPTQIASTGILGTALWLAFFALLIALIFKAISHMPESRASRFVLVSSLFLSVFLWAASFLYAPSMTMLMLTFAFSGLLVASLCESGLLSVRHINLVESSQTRFVSLFLMGVVVLGALGLGWIGGEKTVSAYYFKKAVDLSNVAGTPLVDIENQLIKAIQFAPADIHYVALSRVNFSKAQMIAQKEPTTDDSPQTTQENQQMFQEALSRAIQAARAAVSTNPAGYENWVQLGTIYSALVPKPLLVEGAYENAKFAYNEALKRNPTNPELPLLLAQLELNNEKPDAARSYIRNSVALKEDYADAYLMLAQLEAQSGNAKEAIASAEALAKLVPNNPGIHFELGLLKYSSEDYDGAETAFRKALELSPQYGNAKYYLGLTYQKQGRKVEARTIFEELFAANPDSAELKSALEALK